MVSTQPFDWILNRVLRIDPGFVNLVNAVRGTLAVVASFLVLSFLAKTLGQPPTVAFVGVMMAMNASMFVRDASRKQQLATMLLVPVPASLGFTASVALGDHPQLRVAGLMAVIFFAVIVRRWGMRWFGLGTVLFMAYFLPLFFPIHVDAIPFGVLAILIAVGIVAIIRFLILADHPRRMLESFLRTYALRKREILDAIESRVKSGGNNFDEAESILTELSELSLMIEDFLSSTHSTTLRSEGESLKLRIFEQELSLRQLLDQVRDAQLEARASESWRNEMLAEISKLRVSARPSVADVEKIIEELEREPALAAPVVSNGLHITTKQAIQATLATALASAAGWLISPQRWYWASLACFFVFIGASRGDALMRATYRIVGTAAGLVLGFFFAHFVAGHRGLEWTLIVVCIFCGIFGARLAFGFWTAALFTAMIAVLFDVLGQLTNGILLLRLEETIAGAIIGAVIGSFVFPTSTRAIIRAALVKLLRTMDGVLAELPLRGNDPVARRKLVRRIRATDRELQNLRMAASPVLGKISVMKRGDLPSVIHESAMLSHYVMRLATTRDVSDEFRERVSAQCTAVREAVHAVADRIEGNKKDLGTTSVQFSSSADDDLLSRIEQILNSLQTRSL